MASFAQDFSAPGTSTISDFNPSEDTLDLQGFGGNPTFSEISVTGAEGGTVIGYGGASTVLVEGVTPDQLRLSNVTIDGGELTVGPSGQDLESIVNDLAAGNDLIIGGIANNTIDGGAGDDTIKGFMGHDTIIGGEGDDTLEGMRGKDYLDGGEGDDLLDGGRGVDRLDGGTGDDTLIGGGANDVLTGGEGRDTFVQNFAVSGNDVITDFDPSEDTIELQGFENINLDEFAITEVDGGTLINAGTGNSLFVEGVIPNQLNIENITLNGEALTLGSGDTLESVLNNLATDAQQDGITLKGFQGDQTFAGGSGDDDLFGQDGDDTLRGRGGDDILGGGRGDDILEGGAGDDILSGGRDEDVLEGGAGDDTLIGGKGDDTLTGGRGSDTFVQNFGEQGADTITDFNPSQDTIDLQGFGGIQNISRVTITEVDGGTVIGAGSGNTLLIEGVTPDQLNADNITVDGEALAVGSSGSDLGSILSDLGGNESEAADVNLQGGDRDDTIAGGAGDDTIKGGGGEDTLEGGAGDDTLKGSSGDDTLRGGAGDDTLVGGRGADTFIQDFSVAGNDTITDFNPDEDVIDIAGLGEDNLAVEVVDGGTLISAGEDNSLFVENVTPEQLAASNITVDGQALTNDSPLGSILSNFDGNNSATEGEPEDEVNDTATATADEDVAAVDVTLKGGGGDDTLEGGAGDDILRGGRGDDTLEGGAGDDRLVGAKGDDTLEGGAGDDLLKGGTGDDTLEGGAGDDSLVGGRGADTFIQDFSQPGSDTITDFNPGQDTINFTGLDDLANISVEEADGGTLINAGPGNSLFVEGVTLDQFSADNITIDGQEVSSGLGDFDFGSVLGDAASGSPGTTPDALDVSLGESLDASASQGGAVAESQAAVDGQEQAGAVSEAAAAEEAAGEEAVEEALDEAAAG
jgi:Ca2+-binding RTX toxin-like protein